MSKDGFRKYLQPYLEQGTPFCAYWHPRGFGLCLTGTVQVFDPKYTDGRTKPRKVAPSKVERWRQSIRYLRRTFGGEVVIVDFDGHATSIEGDFTL